MKTPVECIIVHLVAVLFSFCFRIFFQFIFGFSPPTPLPPYPTQRWLVGESPAPAPFVLDRPIYTFCGEECLA